MSEDRSQSTNYEDNSTIILQEELDENYDPTEEEILEYAKYLGMELPEDEELLYIAKEGLKAPLPEPWKPCKTSRDEIYYFNFQTGESIWEHPCDQYYKKLYEKEKANLVKKNNKKSTSTKKPKTQDTADIISSNIITNPQTQKLKQEIQQMEEMYHEMMNKYEKEKQFQMEELENDLDEELSNEMEGEDELFEYNEDLSKQTESFLIEEQSKLLKEHEKKVEEISVDFNTKMKEVEEEISQEFEAKKAELKSKLETQHQFDLENVKIQEKSKYDLEISKIDSEVERAKQSSDSGSINISNIMSEVQERIKAKEELLQEQNEQTLNKFKQDLEKRRQAEVRRIENEQNKLIQNESTKLKVEENYKKINNDSTIKEIQNEYHSKYKKIQETSNAELQKKLVALNQQFEEQLESQKSQIDHSLKKEIEKEESNQKVKQLKTEQNLDESFQEYSFQLQDNLTSQKKEYENRLKEQFNLIDNEFKKFTNEFSTSEDLASEIKKIKERNGVLQKYVKQKNDEFMKEVELTSNYESQYKELQSFSQSQISRLNQQEEIFSLSGPQPSQLQDERINSLKMELAAKEKQCEELRTLINQQTQDLKKDEEEETHYFGPSSKNPGSANHANQIQKANQEIQEIKKIILSQTKGKRTERKNTFPDFDPSEIEMRGPKLAFQDEVKRNLNEDFISLNKDIEINKIKEIVIFIENEKREICTERTNLMNELKVVDNLKYTLEKNRSDWRNEMYKYNMTSYRKTALENVKDKLDSQYEILGKQIEDIKQALNNHSKREKFIIHLERKIDVYRNSLLNKDYAHVRKNLETEIIKDHTFYMRMYKYPKEESYNKNFIFDIPNFGDFMVPQHQPQFKFDLEGEPNPFQYKKAVRKNKSFQLGINKTIYNFNNKLSQLYKRDYAKLARNRDHLSNLFNEQSKWLYQMKNEISKTSFTLENPFFLP